MKKPLTFSTSIGILSHLPGMHYIEIPAKVVKTLGGYRIRLHCKVNGKLNFPCGLMALGQGKAYISITKKRLQELGLSKGSKVKVTLQLDSSRYGLPMPAELEEVLKQDPSGRARFDALTPGRQRYILHYVGVVKHSDLRIERALLLIENLKLLPEGKESFRKLLGKAD